MRFLIMYQAIKHLLMKEERQKPRKRQTTSSRKEEFIQVYSSTTVLSYQNTPEPSFLPQLQQVQQVQYLTPPSTQNTVQQRFCIIIFNHKHDQKTAILLFFLTRISFSSSSPPSSKVLIHTYIHTYLPLIPFNLCPIYTLLPQEESPIYSMLPPQLSICKEPETREKPTPERREKVNQRERKKEKRFPGIGIHCTVQYVES